MNPTPLHTATATIARRDTALTDDELRAADDNARRYYRRAMELMNVTGCTVALALRAVEESEKQQ